MSPGPLGGGVGGGGFSLPAGGGYYATTTIVNGQTVTAYVSTTGMPPVITVPVAMAGAGGMGLSSVAPGSPLAVTAGAVYGAGGLHVVTPAVTVATMSAYNSALNTPTHGAPAAASPQPRVAGTGTYGFMPSTGMAVMSMGAPSGRLVADHDSVVTTPAHLAGTGTGSHLSLAADGTLLSPMSSARPGTGGGVAMEDADFGGGGGADVAPHGGGGGVTLVSTSSTAAGGVRGTGKLGLKDFVLLKVVGKGSFGKVMQVRNKHTGRIYAMKVLAKANIIRRNQVEHTRTERNVLGRINHPFIVGLNAAFQTADKLYFVLDYCAGGELFFHLGREGRFAEERTRFYAAQITLALEHLHNLGVIYRDLKPENVLLDHEGEPPPLPPQWAGRDGERDCAAQHG
jgi:hypothetical protein